MRIAFMLLACFAAVSVRPPAAFATDAPSSPRCNARVASPLEDRVRDLESHPPAESERNARIAQLGALIADEVQEDNVLGAECSRDADLAPIEAELRASQARAYMLQSDIAFLKFPKTCAAAANAAAAGFLASAWRELAIATPDYGPTPKPILDMNKEVVARAALLKLPLPSVADTSNYWMTGLQTLAREAIARCPE